MAAFLPLVTREKNFLLANLRHQLKTQWIGQADGVWSTLVQVVQYPDVRPTLPHSQIPSSSREQDDEPERIQLTRADLMGSFGVLSRARPRTRAGLSRLLVVVELIAMKSGTDLGPAPPAAAPDGREFEIRALRGGGVGLGERQWTALIGFAGLSYRSPRPTPDASSAMSVFSQWSAKQAASRGGVLRPTIATYNALLTVAAKSRSWGLVEGIEDRMLKEGILGNARTVGIRMRMSADRGAHIDSLWSLFEEAFFRLEHAGTESDRTVPWNSMVWHYAQRGMLDEARVMFQAMWRGDAVDLRTLAPHTDATPDHVGSRPPTQPVHPPPPDLATFSSLVQAFSHHGDLRGALSFVELMLQTTSSPSARIATCEPNVVIFASLFRGFAAHGMDPSASPFALDPHLLAGRRARANTNATVRGAGLFPSLRADAVRSTSDASEWSLAALHRLFAAFLAIPPPRPGPGLPFRGLRTAPSSKEVFWVILAFEKLSGGDSKLVLEVWDAVVHTFGALKDDAHPNRTAWRGWMVEQRLRRKVEGHQRLLAEADTGAEDCAGNQ